MFLYFFGSKTKKTKANLQQAPKSGSSMTHSATSLRCDISTRACEAGRVQQTLHKLDPAQSLFPNHKPRFRSPSCDPKRSPLQRDSEVGVEHHFGIADFEVCLPRYLACWDNGAVYLTVFFLLESLSRDSRGGPAFPKNVTPPKGTSLSFHVSPYPWQVVWFGVPLDLVQKGVRSIRHILGAWQGAQLSRPAQAGLFCHLRDCSVTFRYTWPGRMLCYLLGLAISTWVCVKIDQLRLRRF